MRKGKTQILIIVEGEKTDLQLMKRLLRMYEISERHEVVSYKTSIHQLYMHMFADGHPEEYDLLQVLKEKENNKYKKKLFDRVYSDILLVFDLDPQDRTFTNENIREMMNYFTESTDTGRLYINYPMVEAFYHMSSIPDLQYYRRKSELQELLAGTYKKRVGEENRDHSYDHFPNGRAECTTVILQNILKGHMVAEGLGVKDVTGTLLENVVVRGLPDTHEILERQLEALETEQFVWVLCTCVYYIAEYNSKLLSD